MQECNPSARLSVDCSDCIQPGPGRFLDRVCGLLRDASASHGAKRKTHRFLSAAWPLVFFSGSTPCFSAATVAGWVWRRR
jgi:hypothetical protein